MKNPLFEHEGRDGMGLPTATVIGVDTTVTGSLRVRGPVWIDGRVEGDVETDALVVIGEDGTVIGTISAGSVICRGIVLGDIVASEEVELSATASLNGTVRAPLFSVDDSALVNSNLDGDCEVEDGPDGGPLSHRAVA